MQLFQIEPIQEVVSGPFPTRAIQKEQALVAVLAEVREHVLVRGIEFPRPVRSPRATQYSTEFGGASEIPSPATGRSTKYR